MHIQSNNELPDKHRHTFIPFANSIEKDLYGKDVYTSVIKCYYCNKLEQLVIDKEYINIINKGVV